MFNLLDDDENDNDNDKDKDNKDNKDKKDKKEEDTDITNEKIKIFLNENLMYIIGALFSVLYLLSSTKKKPIREVNINEFNTLVEQRQFANIDITKDKNTATFFNVFATLKDGSVVKLTIINNEQFIHGLEAKQIELNIPLKDYIPIKFTSSSSLQPQDENLPMHFMAMIGLSYCLFKLFKNGQGLKNLKSIKKNTKGKDEGGPFGGKSFKSFNDIFDYSKSNAKEFGKEEKIKIKFKDVAGLKSAKKEIWEFVDFLKNPEKYNKLGAKIPRGALLTGPPGTGKTLLAKSVAGESGVPFFAISGSEFVEMFVGVGASRVRDLFKKAKEKAPSIIFIDEIDAIGRKRGGKWSGGNDERENTLNQLLVEMDGFGTDTNVVIMAATNRSDMLDSALLRPGRFDRKVEVTLPDRKDREEILKIYLKKIKLDTSKPIEEYAHRISTLTPGFSGADLANVVNEAAIVAARENKEHVDSESFEKASDRIIAGLETNKILKEKERETVAVHEAGHAVVSWFSEYSNPLVKITIIPRSKGSLGFAQFIPDDVTLHTKEHLVDIICSALGGRMAEELFFNRVIFIFII